ncbi:MAG: YqaA family protein [Candidatus Thalassarchaeaceae archaeon]
MEILPEGLVDSAIEWADGLGYLGLAILTSTEAALQPIPPDPLVWNMILEADSGLVVATVVLIATLSSVLGALAGYAIGMYGGGWLLERLVSQSTILRLNVLVDRYGSAGIFIAAVSPIPYKALAWIAGAGRMDLRLFVAAGIVGRGLRFGIPGALLGIYGESMKSSMIGVEGAITFSIVSIIGLIVVIPAARWWKGLLEEQE